MKIYANHFNVETFNSKLKHLEHIQDLSIFIDYIPQSQDQLTPLNVLVLQEPNEYFSYHDWAIENHKLFSFILTWDDKVLNNCPNALFLPFGHTWFKPEQYKKPLSKKFELSHLRGNLLKTYGHSLRHELLARKNEIQIPLNFYASYGDRYNIEEARIGKAEVFGQSMFGVAIENTSHNGYFTEKILDCFLLQTIPIYWGCSSISNFFRPEGIITFDNIDDLITKVNKLDENYYYNNMEYVRENYQRALQYVDYEQNVVNKITEILKLNNII